MSHLKLSINEPLFCHGGMRIPGLFCGEGLIGTICESRKNSLAYVKFRFVCCPPTRESALWRGEWSGQGVDRRPASARFRLALTLWGHRKREGQSERESGLTRLRLFVFYCFCSWKPFSDLVKSPQKALRLVIK